MTGPAALLSDDARFMAAALAYGARHLGLVAPNPAVGALVVRAGIIVGRGATAPGGRPHAETIALNEAGALAQGATLYVTLEPCSHTGITGPCTDAIIAAGIARVVSALEDPDPRVAGRGHARLRAAGIAVSTGAGAAAARRAHLGHILRVTQGRPMVTLKLAQTRDGYAAGSDHDPRLMITGAVANARTHMLRAQHDAIMVGIGTILADDPLINVRLPGLEQRRPLRLVLDTHLATPLDSRLAATAGDFPTLLLAGPQAAAERAAHLAARKIAVQAVALDSDGRIDLRAALHMLAQRGLTRIFSEGGPRVAAALIAAGLADAVVLCTGPKPLGRAGVEALSPVARARLADPGVYALAADAPCGPDRMQFFERVLD